MKIVQILCVIDGGVVQDAIDLVLKKLKLILKISKRLRITDFLKDYFWQHVWSNFITRLFSLFNFHLYRDILLKICCKPYRFLCLRSSIKTFLSRLFMKNEIQANSWCESQTEILKFSIMLQIHMWGTLVICICLIIFPRFTITYP